MLSESGSTTNKPVVNLILSAGLSVDRMAISRTADFKNVGIIPYSPTVAWPLCGESNCKSGRYDVYVKFYQAYGLASSVQRLGIDYIPVIPPQGIGIPSKVVTPTPSPVVVKKPTVTPAVPSVNLTPVKITTPGKFKDKGFTFTYQNNWKLRTDGSMTYFSNEKDVTVLRLEKLNKTGDLVTFARGEIKKSGCVGDRILRVYSKKGVLYSLHCSEGKEVFRYVFKDRFKKIIVLTYAGEFDEKWNLSRKISKFYAIINSLKIIWP